MAAGWTMIVAYLLTIFSSILPMNLSSISSSSVGNLDRCGGRLERALGALQRDSPRRNRLEEEEADIVYQQKLTSAPLEMTVSRIAVKLPQDSRNHGELWARVEKCSYEPNNNALQTRVMFNDLSVTGIISLLPRDYRAPIAAETCRMSLRLRRAGIEFYTSPIARGRGQMRIRTESSFLEPRFASIYAYGCRPSRVDKQIKRYDKWPPVHQTQQHQIPALNPSPTDEPYEAPEPRQIVAMTKDEDITIANESVKNRVLHESDARLGIWRKNVWVTKIPHRRKKRGSVDDEKKISTTLSKKSLIDKNLDSSPVITPADFARALAKRATEKSLKNMTISNERILDLTSFYNETNENSTNSTNSTKNSLKRETTLSQLLYHPVADRQQREFADNYFDQSLSDEDATSKNDDWQSREEISSEMEDVFLRGASQALTRYIERELHPAIKETLMLSMGYTISYG